MSNSNTGFKSVDDMLIKSTRIICGGNSRPDVYIEDRRDDKRKEFRREILDQVLVLIAKSEARKLGLDYTELSCESADIESIIKTLNVREEMQTK